MASIREQILDAIITKLNGAGKPSGLTVDRFPVSNIEETVLPHIAVRPSREPVSRPSDKMKSYPVRERRLTVKIECRAKCSTGQSPDEAVDPLLTWATKALMTDQTFTKLAIDSDEEEIDWEGEEADSRFGFATMTLSIHYMTNVTDQEKAR